MSDYIKREDAEKILTEAIKQAEENTGCVIVDTFTGWSSIESYAQEAMSDAPSADVVEVRHGHWGNMFNGKFTGGAYWYRCSNCGRIVPDVRNGGWNYCPNCGARMDGEEE